MTFATQRNTAQRAAQFRALSDETRLHILDLLRGGEHCVCELTGALTVGQSLLSFHLKTLKDAGLVRDRREGRWVYYTLDEQALRGVAGFLTTLNTPSRRRTPNATRCGPRQETTR